MSLNKLQVKLSCKKNENHLIVILLFIIISYLVSFSCMCILLTSIFQKHYLKHNFHRFFCLTLAKAYIGQSLSWKGSFRAFNKFSSFVKRDQFSLCIVPDVIWKADGIYIIYIYIYIDASLQERGRGHKTRILRFTFPRRLSSMRCISVHPSFRATYIFNTFIPSAISR